MTIEIETIRNDYIGNGVTVTFPYGFKIFDASQIKVIVTDDDGVEDVQVITADYSVTGAGIDAGGNVVFVTAPPAPSVATRKNVTLLATIPKTQTTDLVNETGFFQDRIETALDRGVRMAQVAGEAAGRGLRLPEGEAATDLLTVLPPLEERKGRTQGYDAATGQPVMLSTASTSISAAMEPVVQAATLALARTAMGPWGDASVTATLGGTARTLAARFSEEYNVLNYGADPTGGASSDTAFQAVWAAVNASSAQGCTIDIPPGTYALSASPGTITRHRVHIRGGGMHSTLLSFNPSAGATLFKFENPVSGNSIWQSSIRDLTCISSNSVRKTAIELVDVRIFNIRDVSIQSFNSTGVDSIGLHTRGREFVRLDTFYSSADTPIRIATNPAFADIGADHFRWTNIYLIAATTKPCIDVDNAAAIYDWSIDGASLNLGTYGIYWAGAGTATTVSNSISFQNVRREQESDATAWVLYFAPSAGCRDLLLRNFYGGTTQNGYYVQSNRVSFEHVFYSCSNAAKTAVDVSNVTRFVDVSNCFWQTGPSVVTTGLTLFEGFYDPVDNTSWVARALYRGSSETVGDQGYETHRSAREWVWAGDIAVGSGNRLAIPASDTRSRKAAFIEIAGYSATGPIKEGGVVVDYPGLNAAVLINGTANFGVGNVAGKLTVFNEGGQCSIYNQTAQTLKVIARVVWAV